jgi:hypothetical protein
MTDRATYLSRRLLGRLSDIQSAADLSLDDAGAATLRRDAIAKVLAVEEGITDGSTIALIADAVPFMAEGRAPSSRDVEGFAEFLRKRLVLS